MSYGIALKIATEAHKGQKRWNDDDYITHPIRVATKCVDNDIKCIAVLHDVVEDTEITVFDLAHKHHFNTFIVDNISYLTKKPHENYADYIMNIKRFPVATFVKIADLKDNLRDLKKGKRRDKYELALKILENKCDLDASVNDNMSEKKNYAKEQKKVSLMGDLSVLLFYLSIWVDGYHLKFFFTALFTFTLALLMLSAIMDAQKKEKKEKD